MLGRAQPWRDDRGLGRQRRLHLRHGQPWPDTLPITIYRLCVPSNDTLAGNEFIGGQAAGTLCPNAFGD